MRFIALACITVAVSACAPANYGYSKHKATYGQHGGSYQPAAQHPAATYRAQNMGHGGNHYNNMANGNHTHSEPTSIYPVGCVQADVSSCTQSYAGPSHIAPKLRGRKKGRSIYGSIGAGSVDFDRNLYAGVIRLGVDGGYLGLEVEGSKGFISDTNMPTTTVEQKLDLDYQGAGFGVIRVPLGSRVKAFGRFGYHFAEFNQGLTTAGVTTTTPQSVDDIAYGGGFEFDVSPKNSLRLDYTGYETNFIGRMDSVTASYLRRF